MTSSDGGLYLSELLASGKCNEEDVETQSSVNLPGLEVDSYSGYITVDTKHQCNLFFWLFPAAKVPAKKAPLLIYLNGGPGNSSMIGLFEEIGPIKVGHDGKLHDRDIAWTDYFNVVFIDSPVGVGFSYSVKGESRSNQDVAEKLYSFLTQFLQLYRKYQDCDIYIGGLSYAGKFVPAFAHKVYLEMSLAESPVNINLKGIFIGSGLCEPAKMLPVFPTYLLSLGLLTERKALELTDRIEYARDKFWHLGKHREAIMDIINTVFVGRQESLGYKEMDNVLKSEPHDWKFEAYLNKPEVQKAIHVRPTQYKTFHTELIFEMAADFLYGVSHEFKVLMENYKVLMFTGHMDMVVSVPMTEAFLKEVEWEGIEEYLATDRKIWRHASGEVAGYYTKVKDFTRVIMRKAGHRTAIDQPEWTLDMMQRFIHDKDFGQ